MSTKGTLGFIAGSIVGIAAGVAVGVLLAPRSGEESRAMAACLLYTSPSPRD